MIEILETLVTVRMTLPEARVLQKVLATASVKLLHDGGMDERELKVYNDIYAAFTDLINDSRR